MKSTLNVSFTALLPQLAEQFPGALAADTQQSKLQEGSDGDGGAWKSRDGQDPDSEGWGGGCPAGRLLPGAGPRAGGGESAGKQGRLTMLGTTGTGLSGD